MTLPINNITDDITLPRKLQFNLQSLKCFSVIHCFIYVHSNISSRKGCWSKLEVIVTNILVEIKNIIIDSSFLPFPNMGMKM